MLEVERHYGAVYDGLDTVLQGYSHRSSTNSMYYDQYSEQFNEFSNRAADLMNELEALIEKLGMELPERKRHPLADDAVVATGLYWFDTVAIVLPDTDISALIDWEESGSDNEYVEFKKRKSALERLSLPQTQTLITGVCSVLARCRQLSAEYHALCGIVEELDYLHAAVVKRDGSVNLHQTAWVE